MRFITISDTFYKEILDTDKEILQKGNRRPHLLVLRLSYKGEKIDFAIPFRSNIGPNVPKEQYFPLPPRWKTRPGRRHGLHYIKMFPVPKSAQEKFWTGEKEEFLLYQSIIERNIKKILSQAQGYLEQYEAGDKPNFSVDIDSVLKTIERMGK